MTRLEDRPLLLGLFGATFALASIAGPLLGGSFQSFAEDLLTATLQVELSRVGLGSIFTHLLCTQNKSRPCFLAMVFYSMFDMRVADDTAYNFFSVNLPVSLMSPPARGYSKLSCYWVWSHRCDG